MKKFLHGIFCLVLLVSALSAQKDKTAPAGGLPPLIDREIIFGNPEISGAQISPNGKYLSFQKPWKDTRNVYVKGVDEPFTAARLMTTEAKRPLAGYFWSRDSKYILYAKDNDGDENFNVYAVDPTAKPAAGSEAPPSRDLTGLKGVRVQIVDLPKADPDTIYIGLNDRDKAWHDLYKLRLSTGEKTLVRKNTDKIAGWEFDLTGNLRLAVRTADNGDTEILRVDPDKFTRIYSCSVMESCGPLQFTKDGKRFYIETNKGDDVDLVGLALFDPATSKLEAVESDPLKRVDFGGALFSQVTDDLVLTTYLDDKQRVYFKNKEFEADYKWLQSQLPGMELAMGSRTRDEQTWLVTVINFLERRPEWKNTAIIVAYDDSDGWYDHQMGPIMNQSTSKADGLTGTGECGDGTTALAGPAVDHAQGRCGYGPRLPLLVISPFARRNFVDHSLTDQTSVLRFIEDNWLDGERVGGGSFDAIAGSIDAMFDFSHPDARPLILDKSTGQLRK